MKFLVKDSVIVGMALFAMFFGAGNIIFPPYIGLGAGEAWLTGFLFYFVSDIGLALLTLYALLTSGSIDRAEGLMYRLGRVPAALMMGAIVVCLGPLLGLPRTAATTFAISIAPLTGGGGLSMAAFTALFFLVVMAFTLRESKMVEIVGKYLTPFKFFGLFAIILGGILMPIGPVNEATRLDSVMQTGIMSGYQTMDVLAAMMFGLVVINALKAKGHTSSSAKFMSMSIAGLVAAVLLMIIYGGLCYLGATVSAIYPMDVDRGQLVVLITTGIFGSFGSIMLGVIVSISCLATAIALAGATGTFFSSISGGKLPYNAVVALVCLFSAVTANFGLSAIIAFADPILAIIYPGALTVVILSLAWAQFINNTAFKGATFGAMAASACLVLEGRGLLHLGFTKLLPLAEYGFGWIMPAAACGLAAALAGWASSNNKEADQPI